MSKVLEHSEWDDVVPRTSSGTQHKWWSREVRKFRAARSEWNLAGNISGFPTFPNFRLQKLFFRQKNSKKIKCQSWCGTSLAWIWGEVRSEGDEMVHVPSDPTRAVPETCPWNVEHRSGTMLEQSTIVAEMGSNNMGVPPLPPPRRSLFNSDESKGEKSRGLPQIFGF